MTDRSELVAIRDALDAVLKLPDAVLAIIAGLLPPPRPARGNGLDQDPPDRDPPPQPKAAPAKAKPAAPKGKPSPEEVAARENELIEAIRDHPSARTGQLATLTASGTSTVIERLRRLQRRGAVTRTDDGWRVNPTPPPSPSA